MALIPGVKGGTEIARFRTAGGLAADPKAQLRSLFRPWMKTILLVFKSTLTRQRTVIAAYVLLHLDLLPSREVSDARLILCSSTRNWLRPDNLVEKDFEWYFLCL